MFRTVGRSSLHAASTSDGESLSSALPSSATRQPTCRLKARFATKPITWKNGVKHTVPAVGFSYGAGHVARAHSANHSSPACVCGTALGVPVVPPVKKTAAGEDGDTVAICSRSAAASASASGANGSSLASILQMASIIAMRTLRAVCAADASARKLADATSNFGFRSSSSRCVTSAGFRQLRLIEHAPRVIAPSEIER